MALAGCWRGSGLPSLLPTPPSHLTASCTLVAFISGQLQDEKFRAPTVVTAVSHLLGHLSLPLLMGL